MPARYARTPIPSDHSTDQRPGPITISCNSTSLWGGCTLEQIRWGILGTGAIAGSFATGLQSLGDARLAAVGSRSAEKAAEFAGRFGNPRTHASYEALANDPEIDIIYIATPHPMHYPAVKLCLEAGKAVLCEKPFT